MIRIKQKSIIEINDWDILVEHTYNKPYNFQQQDGCKDRQTVYITIPEKEPIDFENKQIPFAVNGETMGVSFETWLNTKKEDTLKYFDNENWRNDMFWERNFYPSIDMIINDLYSKGLIEAGEYGIEIDW